MSNAKQIIDAKIESAVTRAVLRSDVDAEISAVTPISDAVKAQITPIILNATNNEPWYQSKVKVGNYIAIAATVIGPIIGKTVSLDDQAMLTSVVTAAGVLLGAGLSLYGRIKAKKPLFS